MIQEQAKILLNQKIAQDVYKMEFQSSLSPACQPGQFIEIAVPGFFLRRPISICEIKDKTLTIIYKVVGEGTQAMAKMEAGQTINVFGPCGQGFPKDEADELLLVGGGVGVPPLYEVAKENPEKKRIVVLGFNSKADIFYEQEFKALGCQVYIATMDGSYGTKGTVMDVIHEHKLENTVVLACGPLPMLKAIDQTFSKGYLSLESRMACGIGACMGCVVDTVEGKSVRVCKDGPVFPIGMVKL